MEADTPATQGTWVIQTPTGFLAREGTSVLEVCSPVRLVVKSESRGPDPTTLLPLLHEISSPCPLDEPQSSRPSPITLYHGSLHPTFPPAGGSTELPNTKERREHSISPFQIDQFFYLYYSIFLYHLIILSTFYLLLVLSYLTFSYTIFIFTVFQVSRSCRHSFGVVDSGSYHC